MVSFFSIRLGEKNPWWRIDKMINWFMAECANTSWDNGMFRTGIFADDARVSNIHQNLSFEEEKKKTEHSKECQLMEHLLSLPIFARSWCACKSARVLSLYGKQNCCWCDFCCLQIVFFSLSTHTIVTFWHFAINFTWISRFYFQIMEKLSKLLMLSRPIRVKKWIRL